jgi:rare lipoprotein A
MCVRRCTRVAYVAFLVGSAVFAATSSSQAQSLSEAVSASAAGAAEVAPVSEWSTVTQPDPPKPSDAKDAKFDHWQAKITLLKPSFSRPKKVAAAVEPPPYALHGPLLDGTTHPMNGLASFYGSGKRTATGEVFDPMGMTAAHRTLPFGTRVRVTRVDTGQSIIVRINDRGPFKPGRVIDLSRGAAEHLKITDKGLAAVKIEVVDREDQPRIVEPSSIAPHAVEPRLVENVAQRSLRR